MDFAVLRRVLLAAAVLSPAAGAAATITGDTYAATVLTNLTDVVIPETSGVAGSGDLDQFTFDITGSGQSNEFMEVVFIGETILSFAALGSIGDHFDLVYSISGLDFTETGSPVAITDVVLINEAALRAEFQTEDFTSPTIAFGPNGFTATFGFMSDGTFADGLRFQFRITTEGDTVAPIPLPASALLLTAALGALAIRRRRL